MNLGVKYKDKFISGNKSEENKFILSDKNAINECKILMKMFERIYGNGILSGQHCNKASATDFEYTKIITGKTPAIVGFDFLSYSLSTKTDESDFDCIDEIINNRGSVEKALDLGENSDVIITFCWHWFSPINGRKKSFYTENTDFNLEKALIPGTEENTAIIKDLDAIAMELKKFNDKNIPILWRPLHEASGGWFWWGAWGAEACIKLYRLMYDRYVNHHNLHNLIWIWNTNDKEWYPGDDVVDIMSNDYYSHIGDHNPLVDEFTKTDEVTNGLKPVCIGENGPIPDPELIKESGAKWLWFMTWNNFSGRKLWNTREELIGFYNNNYVINMEDIRKIRNSIESY